EEMSSTEIGHLAAIPHTLYNEQGKSFISILVLNKPILWNEFFVQVVFLLNVNKNKVNLWKPMFLNLFTYIKKKKGIDSLLKNKSYSLFIKEFIDTFD
ncbi:MAG TPA: PTS sugar transporter subunit IIA, partial [Candidatus Megamonas gallistercoris]|nr:PTS sugar transporter subunit IIA [Candidatus Megamonas gallistercoris]